MLSDVSYDWPRDSAALPYQLLKNKLEDLDVYTRQALIQFPKIERHFMVADIRGCLAKIDRLAVVAWKRYHKKTTLQDLDIELDVLRGLVRRCVRLGFITPNKYHVWAGHVNELGRMIGGWIKKQKG